LIGATGVNILSVLRRDVLAEPPRFLVFSHKPIVERREALLGCMPRGLAAIRIVAARRARSGNQVRARDRSRLGRM